MNLLASTEPLLPSVQAAVVDEYLETRDPKLEARLVAAHLRLVPYLLQSLRYRKSDYDDLIQEGSLGLVHAIRRYDPKLGKLSSYAAIWIRAYQLRFIMSNHRLVKLGTSQKQRKIFFSLGRARARLESAGQTTSAIALAEQLGVPEASVAETEARIFAREASIDAPLDANGPHTLLDVLCDDAASPEEQLAEREEHNLIASVASSVRAELRDRDRALFDARWLEEPAETLQSIGRRFGISRERACQLNQRILELVRRRLKPQLADAKAA